MKTWKKVFSTGVLALVLAGCGSSSSAQSTSSANGSYAGPFDEATGYAAAERYKEEGKIVALATASPFKFPAYVLNALGEEVAEDEFANLRKLTEVSGQEAPRAITRLQELPVRFEESIGKEEVRDSISRFLKEHVL